MWRTPANGKCLTKGLFYELSYDDPKYAIYTTKDEDYTAHGVKYKSFKKKYLEVGDPTEYEQSQCMCEGWKHWNIITNSKDPLLQNLLAECRDELEVRLRSKGIKEVSRDATNEESRSAIQSAKWLADRGWEAKRKAGAPTKEEKKRELKVAARMDAEVVDLASRLN